MRQLPGPGDLYERATAREEREARRAAIRAHGRGERCDDEECEACAHYEDERDGDDGDE